MSSRRIVIARGEQSEVARLSGASLETVRLALLGKRNGPKSRFIRALARQRGGVFRSQNAKERIRVYRPAEAPRLTERISFLEPIVLSLSRTVQIEEINENYIEISSPSHIASDVRDKLNVLISTLR